MYSYTTLLSSGSGCTGYGVPVLDPHACMSSAIVIVVYYRIPYILICLVNIYSVLRIEKHHETLFIV